MHLRWFGVPAALMTLVVSLSIGGCPPTATTDSGRDQADDQPLTVTAEDHVLAVGEPKVTVIEYGDLQCPVCGRFARDTYPTIKSGYIDTGKVRWVFRHYPLTVVHPQAQATAEASECADAQGRFFEFIDAVFADQSDLSAAGLRVRAEAAGLDLAVFDACIGDAANSDRVQRDVGTGQAVKVTGTPTFFINGKKVVGFKNAADFAKQLDEALADVDSN